MTPATSAQWGQVSDVAEPPATSATDATGPGVQVTDAQVLGMVYRGDWPSPRQWTVAAHYERLDTSTTLPRVALDLEYGIGAAAYRSALDVSASGIVLGVTASAVSASTRVRPAPIGGGGSVRVRVSVTPGAPLVGYVSQIIPYGNLAPAGVARAIAPRGAVQVVGVTVPYAAGIAGAPVDTTGTWAYVLNGGVAVALSGAITLAQAGAGTDKPIEMGVSVPAAANAFVPADVGAGGYHYLHWRVTQ